MRKSLAILILLSFGLALNAETSIRIGGNLSMLQTSNAKAKPGFLIGIGQQWKIFNDFGLGGGLRLSYRSTYLKDKSYKYSSFEPNSGKINYVNLKMYKTSIDLPLFLFKKCNIKNRMLQFSLGYSFSIDISSVSELTIIRTIPFSQLSEEEQNSFKFDYESVGNMENTGSGHKSIEFGLSIQFNRIYCLYIDFIHSYINQVEGLYFKEYLNTIVLGVGVLDLKSYFEE
jgi:hypothetical protein